MGKDNATRGIQKSTRGNRRPNADFSSLQFNRLPPQDLEMEAAVLGAIMLEKEKLGEVREIIPAPECFYADAHQKIYAAFLRLDAKGLPIDLLTVTTALRESNDLELVGGAYYVTSLTRDVVTAANVDAHSRLVMEKYWKRGLIILAGDVLVAAYEEGQDVFELMNTTERRLCGMTLGTVQSNYHAAGSLVRATLELIKARKDNPGAVTGVDTGWKSLNRLTGGGWQKDTLIILAARPSMGKTAFALQLAVNAAILARFVDVPAGVAIFSLEMSKALLMDRLMAIVSGVALDTIKSGELDGTEETKLVHAGNKLEAATLFIDDTAAISIQQLRAKARRLVMRHGVRMILIDYLQLMSGNGNGSNREQEVAQISRDLKALAKELHIPIIALSQLNRAVEGRKGRGASSKPQLSDLRESGAIEQDADMVIFLDRPDYQQAADTVDPALACKADVQIAKSRDGEITDLGYYFDKTVQRWFDKEGYERWQDKTAIWYSGPSPRPDNPAAGIPSNYRLPMPTGHTGGRLVPLSGLPGYTEPQREDNGDEELPF